jgi:CRP/FNR family cyclic AMP-dependent transcriptional regulator
MATIGNIERGPQSLLSEYLRSIPFLAGISEADHMILERSASFLTLKRFEILFHRGDVNEHLYYVCAGMMKVSSHLSLGREVIRKICHPGMLLGEESLYGEKQHSGIAQALDRHTHIVKIKSTILRQMMKSDAHVAVQLFDYVGDRLKKSEYRLESVIAEDARTRVINFLKENALLYGNKVGFNELLLKHNYTQQDIADFTGTSRQTVTTILNDLKRSNVIAMNRRRILIRDVEHLA